MRLVSVSSLVRALETRTAQRRGACRAGYNMRLASNIGDSHQVLLALAALCISPIVGQSRVSKNDLVTITEAEYGAKMGCSVAMWEDFALVGACEASNNGLAQAGLVYSLRVGSRQSTGTVVPNNPAAGAYFGYALKFAEFQGKGLLFVGAPGERGGVFSNVGFVHVYNFELGQNNPTSFTVEFNTLLFAEDAKEHDNFGKAIDFHNGIAVVGAPGPTFYPAGYAEIDDGGAVYTFDMVTGVQLAKLQPRTSLYAKNIGCYGFGSAVALSKGLLVVGAPKAKSPCNPRGTLSGAVFTYQVPPGGVGLLAKDSTWWWGNGVPTYHQSSQLVAPGTQLRVEFGHSVAIQKTVWLEDQPEMEVIVIGSPGDLGGIGALHILGPLLSLIHI